MKLKITVKSFSEKKDLLHASTIQGAEAWLWSDHGNRGYNLLRDAVYQAVKSGSGQSAIENDIYILCETL